MITCSWGAFLNVVTSWHTPLILYTLVSGKIDKVFTGYKIWKIDSGGPTETAFLNKFPMAIKVTDLA